VHVHPHRPLRQLFASSVLALALAACFEDPTSLVPATSLRAVHAITDLPAADFAVDDAVEVDDLEFGGESDVLRLGAGTRTIVVRATGATTDLATLDLAAPDGSAFTLVAIGRAGATGAQAPRIVALPENASAAAGRIAVRALHAAPGTAAVDVYLLSGTETLATATPELTNVAFGAVGGYLNDLVPGEQRVVVTATGQRAALAESEELDLDAGSHLTLLLTGDPSLTPAVPLAVQVLTDR